MVQQPEYCAANIWHACSTTLGWTAEIGFRSAACFSSARRPGAVMHPAEKVSRYSNGDRRCPQGEPLPGRLLAPAPRMALQGQDVPVMAAVVDLVAMSRMRCLSSPRL